jgi:hypothetical protein
VGNFGDYQTWQRWRLEEDHGLQLGKARHLLHSSSDMLFEFPLIWMEFTVSFHYSIPLVYSLVGSCFRFTKGLAFHNLEIERDMAQCGCQPLFACTLRTCRSKYSGCLRYLRSRYSEGNSNLFSTALSRTTVSNALFVPNTSCLFKLVTN